jgi:hypothetical protein
MQEEKSYREYAEFCRRLARTMSARDSRVLLGMADAWDARAEEAARQASKESKKDAGGQDHGATR